MTDRYDAHDTRVEKLVVLSGNTEVDTQPTRLELEPAQELALIDRKLGVCDFGLARVQRRMALIENAIQRLSPDPLRVDQLHAMLFESMQDGDRVRLQKEALTARRRVVQRMAARAAAFPQHRKAS